MKYKDQYVIVRADRAGVFFGVLEEKNGQEVLLSQVRKLYYWDGAAAVEELALKGVKNPDGCKFTVTVGSMEINEVIQTILCSQEAIRSIKAVKEWIA